MVRNPPEGTQRVVPYIVYADAPKALEFICEAFGFTERFRLPMGEGMLGHAEVGYQDNVVMLATASTASNLPRARQRNGGPGRGADKLGHGLVPTWCPPSSSARSF